MFFQILFNFFILYSSSIALVDFVVVQFFFCRSLLHIYKALITTSIIFFLMVSFMFFMTQNIIYLTKFLMHLPQFLVFRSGPVKIVSLLPFLFLLIASCSFLILSFSSADNSVLGGSGGGGGGGNAGILGLNIDPIIIKSCIHYLLHFVEQFVYHLFLVVQQLDTSWHHKHVNSNHVQVSI